MLKQTCCLITAFLLSYSLLHRRSSVWSWGCSPTYKTIITIIIFSFHRICKWDGYIFFLLPALLGCEANFVSILVRRGQNLFVQKLNLILEFDPGVFQKVTSKVHELCFSQCLSHLWGNKQITDYKQHSTLENLNHLQTSRKFVKSL